MGELGPGLQAGKLEKMPPTAPHIDSGERAFAATSKERPLCPAGHHELLGQSGTGVTLIPGAQQSQHLAASLPVMSTGSGLYTLHFSQAGGGGGPS